MSDGGEYARGRGGAKEGDTRDVREERRRGIREGRGRSEGGEDARGAAGEDRKIKRKEMITGQARRKSCGRAAWHEWEELKKTYG